VRGTACAYVTLLPQANRSSQNRCKPRGRRSDWVRRKTVYLGGHMLTGVHIAGVTLSLENGDVWIYNRGNTPVFVDSPTLAENMDRVCKVMPGYCLKAFETIR